MVLGSSPGVTLAHFHDVALTLAHHRHGTRGDKAFAAAVGLCTWSKPDLCKVYRKTLAQKVRDIWLSCDLSERNMLNVSLLFVLNVLSKTSMTKASLIHELANKWQSSLWTCPALMTASLCEEWPVVQSPGTFQEAQASLSSWSISAGQGPGASGLFTVSRHDSQACYTPQTDIPNFLWALLFLFNYFLKSFVHLYSAFS